MTVIVDVTGWREPAGDPPQAEIALRPSIPATIKKSIGKRRLFVQPIQQRIAANAAPDESGTVLGCSDAADAVVATVSVVEAADPEGVAVAGEKLQEAPAGTPEQLNEIAVLKPFVGATATVIMPLWPADKLNAGGVATTEKSGRGRLMV